MNEFNKHFEINKALWDKRTKVHWDSEFYDNKKFKIQKNSLNEIELKTLGSIQDKRVLHLMCHFGQDTLSMETLGAEVVGVDLSPEAIQAACNLRNTLDYRAEFHQSNVYDLPQLALGTFDLIFMSYGTLCWLPDLPRLAEIIHAHLDKDGDYYIVEFHPALYMYDWEKDEISYPYSGRGEAFLETEDFSYTENKKEINLPSYFWLHSLSDTIQAFLNAGLDLTFIDEHTWSPYNCFPNMTEIAPGKFQYRNGAYPVPHLFELNFKKS